jgi:hypothetical protein
VSVAFPQKELAAVTEAYKNAAAILEYGGGQSSKLALQ